VREQRYAYENLVINDDEVVFHDFFSGRVECSRRGSLAYDQPWWAKDQRTWLQSCFYHLLILLVTEAGLYTSSSKTGNDKQKKRGFHVV
jgi:hypothetical protein